MHWRPIISAATFGLSELRWSKVRDGGWKAIGWLVLGTLVLVVPVCWLIGLLAGGILGSAFGINLRGYNPATGSSGLAAQIRYVVVGFVILLVGIWVARVAASLSVEWGSWVNRKRRRPGASGGGDD